MDRTVNTTQIELTRDDLERIIRTSERWNGSQESPVEGDMSGDFDGYEGWSFESAVDDLANAIFQEALDETHQLCLNWTANLYEIDVEGAQIEVSLPERGYVAGGWYEPKHMTYDRQATGIDGLLAIAEFLVDAANLSLQLAQPLIESQHAEITEK